MKVTLISGLWPQKDLNGLTDLGLQIAALGHLVKWCPYDQSVIEEADVYIGHSLGGARCVKIAKASPEKSIKYMGLIDPVAGGWFPIWFWVPGQNFTLTGNIALAQCFKRTSWGLPPSSRILNAQKSWVNFDIDSDHANAPKNPEVTRQILAAIKSLS